MLVYMPAYLLIMWTKCHILYCMSSEENGDSSDGSNGSSVEVRIFNCERWCLFLLLCLFEEYLISYLIHNCLGWSETERHEEKSARISQRW